MLSERADAMSNTEKEEPFCSECSGEAGHRIDCPNGMAFSTRAKMEEAQAKREEKP